MPDKIAIKRLTASDLTFFEWHFRRRNAGNQKSINLNADVFVEKLYPAAPAMATEIPVALTLFGPGLKGPYPLARKIVKTDSYKNWRLNGEFIHNPDSDRNRFNILEPSDLALLRFDGEPLPSRIDTIFVAIADQADAGLHAALSPLVPEAARRSMVQVAREELAAALADVPMPKSHPLVAWLRDAELDAAVEDASYGSEAGLQNLSRRAARHISASDLNEARINAGRIGHDGEGLVHIHLKKLAASGKLSQVVWEANDNAAAPFDFKILTPSGIEAKIDAKSTSGAFERTIHISAAEIAEAAESRERYDLYRVFNITKDGAKLRTTQDIREFASTVVASLERLPPGVRPDSFSVATSCFKWGPVIGIERPDGPEDGD